VKKYLQKNTTVSAPQNTDYQEDSFDSTPVIVNNIPPTQTKTDNFLDDSDDKDLKKDTPKVETPKVETPKVETPKVEPKVEIKTNDLDSLDDSFDKPDKKDDNVKDTKTQNTQTTNTQIHNAFDIDDDMLEFTTPSTIPNPTQNQKNNKLEDSDDLGEVKTAPITTMKGNPLAIKTNLGDLSSDDSKDKKQKQDNKKVDLKPKNDLDSLSEDSNEVVKQKVVVKTSEKKNDAKIDNIFGTSDETSIYNNTTAPTKTTTTTNNTTNDEDDDLFSGF
jgi:hypothetical protein